MTTPRLRPLGAATLALIAALCLTWASATAQEPTAAATGTTLHPGANLIGWVGETAPVSQLFRDIPQLEAVWAWDAELDDWIVAGRNVPEGLGWLWQVSPGMGLYMILNGDQPFLWQRSTEPTRGLVELRTGWNLVAWSGAGETPIDDATKGIGWSLREVRRHNAETQQWTAWTSPERTAQLIATAATDQSEETSTIQRGEALWINVARAVRWLQPTDILPRLVFPGGASDELQTRVREDLESVLAFYRTQYGIHANPDFTVYIPKDVDILVQALRDNGEEVDSAREAWIRTRWNTVAAGWGGSSSIMLAQSFWLADHSGPSGVSGRYTLTHEYFHTLQQQFSGSQASQYLIEGTAEWASEEHRVLEAAATWQDIRRSRQSVLTNSTPTLRSTESINAAWQYALGWLATDRLVATTGSDSWLEVWRRMTPTEIGPHRRWISMPDWRTAFIETFDLSVSDFYAKFDAQQREWVAANGASANSYYDDDHWIHGRVTYANGEPVAGEFVNAIRVEGETCVGWSQRAEIDADGAFAIRVPEDGDYHLSFLTNSGCYYGGDGCYYHNSGWGVGWTLSQAVTVSGSDVHGIDIQLRDTCRRFLSGQVVDAIGQPVVGISIAACWHSVVCEDPLTWPTTFDGSFAVPVRFDSYRLRIDLRDDCNIWYGAGGIATRMADTSPINAIEGDYPHLQIRVPEGACVYQLRGGITKSNGLPLADVPISACSELDDDCRHGRTDATGSFAITVPTESRYRLRIRPSCVDYAYFGEERMSTSHSEARLFDVAGQDIRLALQVPATLCDLHIGGRLASTDGAPLADIPVFACPESGGRCHQGHTNTDGSFSLIAPLDGRYRIGFAVEGCYVHFNRRHLTINRGDWWFFDVAGTGIRLPQRQVPTGICDG